MNEKRLLYTNKDCWLQNNCNRIDCNKFCMRYFKLNYLYDSANISMNQRRHINLRPDDNNRDIDAFKKLKNIELNIEQFVKQGTNLYLHSNNTGNGKTSWALRLVQAYFNKIWFKCNLSCKALFINVPRFLLALKDNISDKNEYVQHIKDNINVCDIIIWDDIGTKSVTVFEAENLLALIDIRENKTNIFTSNLNDDELHKFLGDRLASRIVNNSINIELFGADKRGLEL